VIDRRNRTSLAVFGLLLAIGGGLSAALGGGVFGADRSERAVFDATVIRSWNEGGWKSFAVVVAIGFALFALGASAVLRQFRRNDGRSRTPTVQYPPDGGRGETTLRAGAVSSTLETDLEKLADVEDANVGLFGEYPSIELRAVLTVVDTANLDNLHHLVDEALVRLEAATTIRPDPVQVTIRFKAAATARQLH
jgi:hypothetical protein